jgi:hypothetical protein
MAHGISVDSRWSCILEAECYSPATALENPQSWCYNLRQKGSRKFMEFTCVFGPGEIAVCMKNITDFVSQNTQLP